MLNQKILNEIQHRDFFKNVDHYHDFDDIETVLVLGSDSEEVFLTVIIPVYDHPLQFITRAIESVLQQDEKDISYRILIIDDMADPKKNNGVEDYCRKNPNERIVYYKNKKNLGVFGNWNRGIQLANSEWVTLLHSDDFYKPNYFKNMIPIIRKNSNIDQLACKYELLDYTLNNVDENKAMKPYNGNAILRKVDYREYTYEMFTSVKGSIYKKETLINIGGFRSQGIALGLDDYSLMMRYAFYYNTYYLDAILYVDSWGFNDSLNIKHWYPQLIADFFMWKNIEQKRLPMIRHAYEINDIYILKKRANEFADGTSYIKKKIPVDFSELYDICDVNNKGISKLNMILARIIVKLDQKRIKYIQKKEKVYVK